MKTYYEVLGVSPDASTRAIKDAYRKLVKKYHPDVSNQKTSLQQKFFEEINQAYGVLIHPEKRKKYDLSLKEKKNIASLISFQFRELKEWLFSRTFLKMLFASKSVANTVNVYETVREMSVDELLQRIIYSKNLHVQLHAVRALMAKGKHYPVHDLLRLLYSGIHEDVKVEIIEGLKNFPEKKIKKVLLEIYSLEKSLKVRQAIRHTIKI